MPEPAGDGGGEEEKGHPSAGDIVYSDVLPLSAGKNCQNPELRVSGPETYDSASLCG